MYTLDDPYRLAKVAVEDLRYVCGSYYSTGDVPLVDVQNIRISVYGECNCQVLSNTPRRFFHSDAHAAATGEQICSAERSATRLQGMVAALSEGSPGQNDNARMAQA